MNRILTGALLLLALSGRLEAQPNILTGPVNILNQTVNSTVSLLVKASSPVTTNLQYQWHRNGVLIPGATSSNLTLANIQAQDGGAYTVEVSDGSGVTVSEPATVNVSVLGGILQAVDQIIDALDLGTNGLIRSYNTNAVKQPGTPEIIAGDPGGSEIWFQWEVPLLQSSGIVTFSTLGSDFDTTMAIYTGSQPTNLSQVPTTINDDDSAGYLNSQVSFYAVKGTTYLIALDGYYGASGNVVLNWNLCPNSAKPPNTVPVPQFITASNGATVTLTSPWAATKCDWLFNGQLFATNASTLTISNLGDATVGSYVPRLTVSGMVMPAEPIVVQINTLQNGSTATNSAIWTKYLNSSHSGFAQGSSGQGQVRKLGGGGDSGGYSCSQVFSTVGNPDEPGEPVVCSQVGGHPGWYSYITPAAGALMINTTGSTFNTILGVYIGPGNSFTNLTNVGCGYTTNYLLFGQPSVYIPSVPAGQTNYIVVEGENGASGVVHLNLYLGNPLTVNTPPLSQSVPAGSNATLSVGVTGTTPVTYSWQFNGATIPGATTNTLTIANMQATNAGTYTVFMSNLVSVISTQAVLSYVAPPVITSQPAGKTVPSNSPALLSVAASASPSPVYQWFFNGVPTGGNSNSLSVPAFTSSNQGTYNVIVSNMVGTVTSAPAILLLNGPLRVSSCSMSAGAFSLQIAGTAGGTYIIEGSSNLTSWTPLFTNNTVNGIINFTDTNAGSQNFRFYRTVTN